MPKTPQTALDRQMKGIDQDVSLLKAAPDLMKMDQSLSPSAVDAEMFGEMRKSLGSSDRPKRGIYALLDGVFLGAQMGSKKKLQGEMLEKYKKWKGIADEVFDTRDATRKNLAEKAKEEQVLDSTGKFATDMFSTANSGLSQDEIDRANAEIYENMKSVHPELKGTQFASSPQGKKFFNILDQEGNPRVYNYQSMMNPQTWNNLIDAKTKEITADARTMSAEASMKRAELEPQRLNIDQQRVNAYNRDISNRWNPKSQFLKTSAEGQGKKSGERVIELENQIDHWDDTLGRVQTLKSLLTDPKRDVITGNTLAAKSRRLWASYAGTQALSDSELYDAIAGGLFGFVKGEEKYGNLNQNEFGFLTGRLPLAEKTKAAALGLINQFEATLNKQIATATKRIGETPNANPLPKSEAGQGEGAGAEKGSGGGTITLLKYGKTKTIPTTDYAKSKALAKQQGFGVVE